MKFRKFGKALLMGAVSLGAILSVSACVQSYTVGFLYVTGTQTSGTSGSAGQGIISGFKIDHNTGKLTTINGMPVSSGGAYPNRAVLLLSSRFLYVLNQGGSDCTTTATDPGCANANIVQYSVSGNGSLIAQQTFYTQGKNPFRMIADATGAHIYVLDHDAPDSGKTNAQGQNSCTGTLGNNVTTCGDITVFNVDPSTGRLSIVVNAQAPQVNGSQVTYFPVPVDPIDVLLNSNFVFTLSGNSNTGNFVFPYNYNTTGQLTLSQNGVQTMNIQNATAIQAGNGIVYILDNTPLTYIPPNGNSPVTVPAQLHPYNLGAGGALQSLTGGAVPDVPAQTNPLFLLAESKGKWVYVANAGDNTNATVTNTQSGLAGFVIDTSSKQLTTMSGSPFGSGSGPSCLVEDPSNQFIYTANFNDSSVSGAVLDPNVGTLSTLPGKSSNKAAALNGPATYCLVNGRTS